MYSGITKKIQDVIDIIKVNLPAEFNYYIGRPFWMTNDNTVDINFFPNVVFYNTNYNNNNNLGVNTGNIITTMAISSHSENDELFTYMEEEYLSKILEDLKDVYDDIEITNISFNDDIQGLYTISIDLNILFEYKTI